MKSIPQAFALEQQAKELGVTLRIEKIDITKEGDRRRAATWDTDILVNAAGITEGGAVIDVLAENMRRQFELNVIGMILLTQKVARNMVAPRCG